MAFLTLLGGGLSRAGTFTADFNAGIPAGVNLQGTAANYDPSTGGVNNSGVLKLTEATGNQQGSAILDDFDAGAPVGGFDVSFDLYIGSGNGADGLSFCFGDFADGTFGEEGPGNISGLTTEGPMAVCRLVLERSSSTMRPRAIRPRPTASPTVSWSAASQRCLPRTLCRRSIPASRVSRSKSIRWKFAAILLPAW